MLQAISFSFVVRIRRWFSDEPFGDILKGSTYALSARMVGTVLGLVCNIVVARFYGAGVLGIVAVVNSVLLLGATFTILGTNTALLRLIPEHLTRFSASSAFQLYRRARSLVIVTSLAVALGLLLMSGFVARHLFGKPHLGFYLILAALIIVFRAVGTLNIQAMRGLLLIKCFALMQVLQSVTVLVLLVVLAAMSSAPEMPVYAYLAAVGIAAIAGGVIVSRAFRRRRAPGDRIHPVAIRGLLSLSVPMWMTSGLMMIIGQTGVVILGVFRSDAEVGQYAVAIRLAALTTFILLAVEAMAAPRFSELFQQGRVDELFDVAKRSSKLIFWATAPILVILLLFGRTILGMLFGPSFVVAYPAVVFLVAGQFVNSIAGCTASFMNMTGHHVVFRNIVLLAALINVIENLILVPIYGMKGAAIAAATSLLLWNCATLGYIGLKYGQSIGFLPVPAKW